MNIEQVYEKTRVFLIRSQNELSSVQSTVNLLQSDDARKAYLYFDDEQLVFSIEGLYHYLNIAEYLTYNQYRRMLYSSELNKDLSAHQTKIVNHRIDCAENVNIFTLVAI